MNKLLRRVMAVRTAAQLLLLTVLPLTVILGIISFGSISMHQQAMRRLVSERDVRAVVAIAGSIGAIFQHKTDMLVMVADSSARMSQRDGALLIEPDQTHEYPGGIAVYDQQGVLIAHTSTADSWAQSNSLLSGAFKVSPVENTAIGSYNGMVVFQAHDHARNVIVIGMMPFSDLHFDTLANPPEMTHSSSEAGAVDAYLFGPDGSVLIDTLTAGAIRRTRMSDQPGVVEALQGQSGGLFRVDANGGDEHVVSYAPIATSAGLTGLGVIIEEPWETVLDPLMRYSLAVPLITLPVLLLAVIAVMFGLRRIVQPLQRLDQQARDIGHGNYDVLNKPVHGIDEIEQLQNTLRKMVDQIQADQERLRNYARAVTETQEAERKRLARELHDDTIQNLVVLSQRIQVTRQKIAKEQPHIAAQLDDLRGIVLRTIEDVRRFSRALRPIYLEDAGLAAALDRLVDEANDNERHNPNPESTPACTVTFTVRGTVARLKPEVELALFRIAQEALTNALRHASPSTISVVLSEVPTGRVQLVIEDNGRGFTITDGPTEPVRTAAAHSTGGFGLLGIHERAMLIGAGVDIRATPGHGACVTVLYPTVD